jgi:hypothetical protein
VRVDGGEVAAEDRLEHVVGDRVAAEHLADDALRRHAAPLATHLVAALAAEPAEVLVEAAEALVVPLVLEADPLQVAGVLERRDLVRAAEVDVHPRERVLRAQLAESSRHRGEAGLAVRPGRRQQARAGHGRERHADQQLRVVGDPGALRGVRPAPVEDEFTLAVLLQVERTRGQEPLAVAQQQRHRLPALVGRHAAGLLQRGEPFPFQERRFVADQRVPVGGRDARDTGGQLEALHRKRVYWSCLARLMGFARLRLAARAPSVACPPDDSARLRLAARDLWVAC